MASLSADVVDFFFDREVVERLERKIQEKADAAVEHEVGIAEGFFDLLGSARDGGGIGDSPVSGHRLAGPDGADLLRGVVADGEDEVELGRIGARKFFPAFAAEIGSGKASGFDLLESFGAHFSGGKAAG